MTIWNIDCALRPKQKVEVRDDFDGKTLFFGVEAELQDKCVADPEFSKRKVLTVYIERDVIVVEVKRP